MRKRMCRCFGESGGRLDGVASKLKEQRPKDKGRFKANEPRAGRADHSAITRQRTEGRWIDGSGRRLDKVSPAEVRLLTTEERRRLQSLPDAVRGAKNFTVSLPFEVIFSGQVRRELHE